MWELLLKVPGQRVEAVGWSIWGRGTGWVAGTRLTSTGRAAWLPPLPPRVPGGLYPPLLLVAPHLILMIARRGEGGLDLQGEQIEQVKGGKLPARRM